MKVLFVTPEVAPYSATGGLAQVTAALPKALQQKGVRVSVFSPFYRGVSDRCGGLSQPLAPLKIRLGKRQLTARLLSTAGHDGVRQYFIDIPEYFDRPSLYGENGGGYEDNHLRYAAFSKAALSILQQYDLDFDILHCHDWQSGLVPMFRKTARGAAAQRSNLGVVYTIHNLAFQGIAEQDQAPAMGIPQGQTGPKGLEFYGKLNLMKSGIIHSDLITTVSPRYAEEICTEELGAGLDGVLTNRRDALSGILNGVDYSVWSPEADSFLEFQFDADNQNGKRRCKASLQQEAGLPVRPRVPLIGVVSRLAEQKGIDLLIDGLRALAGEREFQAVILGTGSPELEEACRALAKELPDRVSVYIEYDETLAHHIFAGSDVFAMPSRFEPCGLSQLYAMRYGSIPVVRDTGGLHDTVQDFDPESGSGTGFVFSDPTVEGFSGALSRALEQFSHARSWRRVVATAMVQNFSWERAAEAYRDAYQSVLEMRSERQSKAAS